MDYYNLSQFPSIETSELIEKFSLNETIKIGAISVFGDSIGKPGDIIYSIKSIYQKDLDKIIFDLGNLKLIVTKPIDITINEKVIGVSMCSKIEWIDSNLYLEYTVKNNMVQVKKNGNHIFRVKENTNALMIYIW